jgi:hypothetical protein
MNALLLSISRTDVKFCGSGEKSPEEEECNVRIAAPGRENDNL